MFGNKGFSLIEVMVSAAVICVMSTFSFPSFLGLKYSLECQAIADGTVMDLHLARMEAIKNNCYVVIQLMEHGYTVFKDDGKGSGKAGDWILHEDEEIIAQKKFDNSISLSSNFKANHLRFRGVVGMTPGTIKIENDKGKTTKVVISRVGRLRQE